MNRFIPALCFGRPRRVRDEVLQPALVLAWMAFPSRPRTLIWLGAASSMTGVTGGRRGGE